MFTQIRFFLFPFSFYLFESCLICTYLQSIVLYCSFYVSSSLLNLVINRFLDFSFHAQIFTNFLTHSLSSYWEFPLRKDSHEIAWKFRESGIIESFQNYIDFTVLQTLLGTTNWDTIYIYSATLKCANWSCAICVRTWVYAWSMYQIVPVYSGI